MKMNDNIYWVVQKIDAKNGKTFLFLNQFCRDAQYTHTPCERKYK